MVLLVFEVCLHGLTGSTVGHRFIAPAFKPRLGYVRRVFHLSFRLINFGGRSAHLAKLVHKSGHKTSTGFDYISICDLLQKIAVFCELTCVCVCVCVCVN